MYLKQNKARLNLRLPAVHYRIIKDYASIQNITVSMLIRRLIRSYITKMGGNIYDESTDSKYQL